MSSSLTLMRRTPLEEEKGDAGRALMKETLPRCASWEVCRHPVAPFLASTYQLD